MFALVVPEHANGVDSHHAAKLLLMHDIVEIDAGDAPIHVAGKDKPVLEQDERRAAERVSGLRPLYLNTLTDGGIWTENGVTSSGLLNGMGPRSNVARLSCGMWPANWPASISRDDQRFGTSADQTDLSTGRGCSRAAPATPQRQGSPPGSRSCCRQIARPLANRRELCDAAVYASGRSAAVRHRPS